MNSIQTKTIKVKVFSCLVTELCEEYRIPFVVCKIIIKKCLKTGKDIKMPEGIPEGWQKWSYDECIEHNVSVKFQPTHINVLLRSSPFMVVDFDNKEDIPSYLHLFGDDWKSKSSARGLPHLWRLKKENDFSKCAVGIQIDGKKTHIDLKYFNIFERIDSKIEYSNTTISEFDFETYHNKPISEKPVPQEQKPASDNYNLIMGNYSSNRIIKHLHNCNEEFIATYSDWFKIGRAIKNVFQSVQGNPDNLPVWLEILVWWSRLSKQHSNEDYDAWEKTFEGESKCGLTTIIKYSQESNPERYNEIEQEYYKLKRDDPEHNLLKGVCYIKLNETLKEFDTEQEKTRNKYPTYEMIKEEFEKKYALIKNIGIYIEETPTGLIQYSQSIFNVSHKMFKYYKYENGKHIECNFIKVWTQDQNMRMYDCCDMYPPPLDKTCPANVYNLWRPFYISTLTSAYEKNEEALKAFINHVLILCNHQESVKDHILLWIGQMLKHPAVKTICPTFISDEGAGKGTLLDWLRSAMGDKKVMETRRPSEHVWGAFNELMADAFLVNLNEMCKKEAEGAEGEIKGLITDNALFINSKGVKKYAIKSYHRFLITTNKEDPIATKKGDRRNLIIRSSDELTIENNPNIITEYFDPLREKIMSITGMRTIYDWLIAQEGLDKFYSLPMPVTEWQEDMKEASKSYYEKWVEDYVITNKDTVYENNKIEMTSLKILELFKIYMNKNNITTFDTNSIKVGLAFKRLSYKGGIYKKSKMNGCPFIFDMAILRKVFMVGCQIGGVEG
jgi:hypothetical protein